ncbi:MAG: hypothetical protein D6800_11825 [Candidatus Zixiibacteriota bacterium]|nr:MAG: hypothetical protein D6800_11825 [candidate division Zixibacteria bacterium]
MMNLRSTTKYLFASLILICANQGHAATIYLSPSNQAVPISDGTATLELFMDFTGDPTIGGGLDLDLVGGISVAAFTPSSFWTTSTDPFFSGFGSALADADFEIHFGSFSGLVGQQKLGDLTVNLLSEGVASINLAINSTFGDFFSTGGNLQIVGLTGAQIEITPVPLPGAAFLLASAFVPLVVSMRCRKINLEL